MKFSSLKYAIFATVFPSLLAATIPDEIEQYLKSIHTLISDNKTGVTMLKNLNYSKDLLNRIIEDMSHKLVERYKYIIQQKDKSYLELDSIGELKQEISNYIKEQHKNFEDFAVNEPQQITMSELGKMLNEKHRGVRLHVLRFVKYGDNLLPIEIIKENGDGFQVLLNGLPIPENAKSIQETKCLILKRQSTEKTIRLKWLGPGLAACAVPVRTQQGYYILEFAEQIAKEVQANDTAKELHLQDASKVMCNKNLEWVSLRLLRKLQDRSGLYESKHYQFTHSGYKSYDDRATQLLGQLTLSQISRQTEEQKPTEFKNTDLQPTLFEETLYNFRKIKGDEDSVKSFLLWVWETNCTIYEKILKHIFATFNPSLWEYNVLHEHVDLHKKL